MESLLFTMRTNVTEILVGLLCTKGGTQISYIIAVFNFLKSNHFLEILRFASLMVHMHAYIFLQVISGLPIDLKDRILLSC